MISKQKGSVGVVFVLILLFLLFFVIISAASESISQKNRSEAMAAPESFKLIVKKCKTVGRGYTCLTEAGGRVYTVVAERDGHSVRMHSASDDAYGSVTSSPGAYSIKVIYPEDPEYEKLAVMFFRGH
ncbi:MAG: hypothetical protein Q7K40_01590 [bacterium]|nr:hypothetical protein [bacterium]